MDVQQSSRMGEHALMYVWMVYAVRLLMPRMQFASVFIHAVYATAIILVVSLLRALFYSIVLGIQANLLSLLWLLLAIPMWLFLAILLTRGAKLRKLGGWITQ